MRAGDRGVLELADEKCDLMHRIHNLGEMAEMLKADLSRYDTETSTDHAGIRLSSAMDKAARAIRAGDRSALSIGYRVVMADPHLPFGKIIKSNFARALKHHIELLTEDEKLNLAGKTAELLSLPFCPREVEDYCRLVKKMGQPMTDRVVAMARPNNRKARLLLAYLSHL